MIFPYFHGPQSEMLWLSAEDVSCALCGAIGPGFALDFTRCEELLSNDPEVPFAERMAADRRRGRFGCQGCLRAGRFTFGHDTEVGVLCGDGQVERFYNHNQPLPPDFPKAAISELERTPPYVSCQQGLWLAHCVDFMIYLGSWQPRDFQRHAPDGDGRALFMKMMPAEFADFWDGAALPGEPGPTQWGDARCYAFQCQHCGVLRGHCDWY